MAVKIENNIVSFIWKEIVVMCILSINNAMNIHETSQKNISILLFTSRHSRPFSNLNIGPNFFEERYCEIRNCFLTDNETYFKDVRQFDVVLFNSRDFSIRDFPNHRSGDQKYILLMADSPPMGVSNSELNELFNFTWSYKLNSGIHWPKMVIRDIKGNIIGPKRKVEWIPPHGMKPPELFVLSKLQHKTKTAAYLVSQCRIFNQGYMTKLNKALEKYSQSVEKFSRCNEKDDSCYKLIEDGHIAGDCKNLGCPNKKMNMSCEMMIESDYYFLLVFEKVIDEDLVSRNLLIAMQHFAVPVVFGGADYSRFLPDGSYINAYGLTPELLAERMVDLIRNRDVYERMFSWRRHYMYYAPEISPDTDPFCQFCAVLNDKKKMLEIDRHNDIMFWFNNYKRGTYFYSFPETDIKIIDLEDFRFLLSPNTCNLELPLPVIGIVASAIQNFERRQTIRQTWGKNTDYLKVVFLLGETNNQKMTRKILEEHEEYGDIVQGLFWVTNRCPIAKYVLKTHDDTFVNIPVLKAYLRNEFKEKDLIACNIFYDFPVIRETRSKWYVSRLEYEKDRFPWFCHGPFIIYNPKVAPLLVDAATNEPYFFMEDVYTTGILRERLKLPLKSVNYLRMELYPQNLREAAEKRVFLFGTDYSNEEQKMLWITVQKYWHFRESNQKESNQIATVPTDNRLYYKLTSRVNSSDQFNKSQSLDELNSRTTQKQ